MLLPSVPLEDWMRDWYFETEYDLGSSGLPPISLSELRRRLEIPLELLDACPLDDSDTLGALGIRQALADRYGSGDPARVMVGSGSNEVLFLLLSALFGPGDDVLVLDPIYHALRNVAIAQGASLRPFHLRAEEGFRVDVERLCDAIRPDTRAVIVNFPHMPTGRSLSASEQRLLVETCRRRGALLLWDGALVEVIHDADPIAPPLPGEDHVIRVGTVSKAFGLPGLRVGWALGAPALLKQVEVWKDHTSLYVSPLLERIAQAVIERADRLLSWRRSQIKENLAVLSSWLETVEGDLASFPPDGGLTIFPRLPRIADVDALCRRLARERSVMVVPGSSFGHPQHIRLGFGAPTEILREGLARLGEALLQGRSGTTASTITSASEPVRPPARSVDRYQLCPEEQLQLSALLDRVASTFSDPTTPRFLEAAPLLAHSLPIGLRRAVNRFRLREDGPGALLLGGLPLDDDALGPTPAHWNVQANVEGHRQELLLLLCGALLGDPFAWTTQQGGRLVHNILPMEAYTHEQVGFSSEEMLTWHTEDAFHPLRPDHLALMCLRNPDGVATFIGDVGQLDLPADVVDTLFEPHFTIRPDKSHLEGPSESEATTEGVALPHKRMEVLNESPPPVAVFYGDRKAPYLRVDPFFMGQPEDPRAKEALDRLTAAMDTVLVEVVLRPGELVLLDNARVVHGRESFTARFDGSDRWLKRINLTRDLRKSRASRASMSSRSLL